MIGLECAYYPGNILEIIHSINIYRAYSVTGSMRGERKQWKAKNVEKNHCCCYYGVYSLIGVYT